MFCTFRLSKRRRMHSQELSAEAAEAHAKLQAHGALSSRSEPPPPTRNVTDPSRSKEAAEAIADESPMVQLRDGPRRGVMPIQFVWPELKQHAMSMPKVHHFDSTCAFQERSNLPVAQFLRSGHAIRMSPFAAPNAPERQRSPTDPLSQMLLHAPVRQRSPTDPLSQTQSPRRARRLSVRCVVFVRCVPCSCRMRCCGGFRVC